MYLGLLFFHSAVGTTEALKAIDGQTFMPRVAVVSGGFVYAGSFAAGLSTSLTMLVSAPRVMTAVLQDGLFPKLTWLAKLARNNDPQRGYFFSIIVASIIVLVSGGNLNTIAPFVTCLYMLVYGVVNLSCFHAAY
eukprot:TRINITY_DN38866_c0_g1_i2.p1 TRINITY_DN38866_c0_g1~~TRINITY_DN38866_c0_g1_i2.p1  ORF type:complete len:135 (+),score=10.82 TRINITY_DN38866_c0_g1_i2:131-535(+)